MTIQSRKGGRATRRWKIKGQSRGLLFEICKFRRLMLRKIILELPRHLPVNNLSEVLHYLHIC
jgi:hypothetical protein